jgi:hypothetical protein
VQVLTQDGKFDVWLLVVKIRGNDEPKPDLAVTGQRLDAKAPPLIVSQATNAYASDIGFAMLVGVDFPTHGCWKVRGEYKKASLEFVVWVAP